MIPILTSSHEIKVGRKKCFFNLLKTTHAYLKEGQEKKACSSCSFSSYHLYITSNMYKN